MHVLLRVDGDDPGSQLDSLRQWLAREEALRGRVETDRKPGRPDDMGLISEALIVAVGSGGVVSVLAHSLQAWLALRRSDVTLEVTLPDGQSVKATATNLHHASEVIEQVFRASADPAGQISIKPSPPGR